MIKPSRRSRKILDRLTALDSQTRGWIEQYAARIASQWGHTDRAEDLQRQAYSHNRNMLRPKVVPPYRPVAIPGEQEQAIVNQVSEYRLRRGFLQRFEEVISHLHHDSSANQFEEALADLGKMIGFSTERRDTHGEGPDVLWLLPSKVGIVIEAKSRKKAKNALTKGEHGQLLVATKWFEKNYPEYSVVSVSVHPEKRATRAAVAGTSHALTYSKLAALVADSRVLLSKVCESQLSAAELVVTCSRFLAQSPIHTDRLVDSYFEYFESEDARNS